MAPQVAERLHAIIAQKRLEVIAGRIIDVAANAAGARVTLRRRGSLATERIDVARIVSCTGVGSRLEASANPLVASLFAARQARADPLRIGVEVSPDCAILDAEGQASRRLFAIGPMSQAAFWEITAVPDIRLQAAELAATILNRANSEAVFNSLPATCR
jgi:uncharacterized NAD(P)/FAD-binding protein YdhS